MRLTVTTACLLTLTLVGRQAYAQADEADRTFQQGISLFDAGKISEACVKFAESFAIDPVLGTLQNLAACHEREGKRAKALGEWSDLAQRAQQAGKVERETLARQHVVDLTTKIPRVTLRSSGGGGGGGGSETKIERIFLDGELLDAARWDKPILIDKAGPHQIVFSASGQKDVTRTFEISDGGILELEMPTLEPLSTSTATNPVETTTPNPVRHEQKKSRAGFVVGGAGIVLLGVGSVFGITAINHRSDSDAECPANRCTQRGVDLNDRATNEAWVANIGIGVGLVAIGIGAYLLLTERAR